MTAMADTGILQVFFPRPCQCVDISVVIVDHDALDMKVHGHVRGTIQNRSASCCNRSVDSVRHHEADNPALSFTYHFASDSTALSIRRYRS